MSPDENGSIAAVTAEEVPAERMELARRFVDLVQTEQMDKFIERTVEEQLAAASHMSDEERDFMRRQMPTIMGRMMDRFLTEVTPIIAETYTATELEVQIRFYETPLGQSIAVKQLDLGARQQALLQPLLVEAMMSLMAKYCAEFDCDAPAAPGVAKPRG